MPRRPLVAVTACFQADAHGMPSHRVGDKYVRAVAVGAGAAPVLVPATGDSLDAAEWVDRFDGFVFTGSLTNVEPGHYGGRASRVGTAHDARRDATTLPLLRALIEADVPILALCRGFQELNVACGGTLHQHVHELSGALDHRAPSRDLPIDKRYASEHHTVRLSSGGLLAGLTDAIDVTVNSLHHQGIDRLGTGLVVEAVAPDGLIEAARYAAARRFVLGVQWHPEACIDYDPFSRAIFAAFGQALRAR